MVANVQNTNVGYFHLECTGLVGLVAELPDHTFAVELGCILPDIRVDPDFGEVYLRLSQCSVGSTGLRSMIYI
jgi:hypothetical protein